MATRVLFLILLAFGNSIQAFASIKDSVQQRKAHLESFYHDLHENPELSGEEKRTSEKVAAEFKSLGLEVIQGLGGYGVVGVLKNGDGPVTLVRSELDALPVTEQTQLSYKSKVPTKMHACGHDFHTAALVGTAYAMIRSKSDWKGTLVFVAQPAEEVAKGASGMIQDGLFKKVPKPHQMLALHTAGWLKKGAIGMTSGYALANVDSIDVVFKGRGTHGAEPHKGIDPFILASEFTLKMQTVVGRERKPIDPAVISVGSMHGGAKHNIIPEEVKLQMTLRTYDPELRKYLKKRVQEVAKGIALTAGAPEPTVSFPEGVDATFNDVKLTERMKGLFQKHFGSEKVIATEALMNGEDFGLFGKAAQAPSLIYFIGAQDEKDPTITNHSPKFSPDFSGNAPLAIESMAMALLDLHKTAKVP